MGSSCIALGMLWAIGKPQLAHTPELIQVFFPHWHIHFTRMSTYASSCMWKHQSTKTNTSRICIIFLAYLGTQGLLTNTFFAHRHGHAFTPDTRLRIIIACTDNLSLLCGHAGFETSDWRVGFDYQICGTAQNTEICVHACSYMYMLHFGIYVYR